jgi:hypothetical protein
MVFTRKNPWSLGVTKPFVKEHIVQGGGRAASKPGPLTAAEGLLDVKQEDKQLGLLQMGLLACTLEQLRGQQLRLVVM